MVAVALASAGVGHVASRVWPLPGSSGSAVQVPPARGNPASPRLHRLLRPNTHPHPHLRHRNSSRHRRSRARRLPWSRCRNQPPLRLLRWAATPSEPLPTLALIPPSVAPPGTPPVEGTAPIEPPRTASQSAAGREEAGKQDTQPVIATPPAVNAAPPKAVNRPIPRQRAAQPAPAPAAPQSGYLNDKALRDFMSYPANGY